MSISWKKYTSLARKKIRERERKFIVEGVRLCNEALLSDWEAEVAFVTQAFTESHHWEQLEELLRQKGIPYRVLREENFQRLTDTKTPQGVLMVMSMFDFRIDQIDWHKTKFVICLDGIRDPGNLGTLIRTADWYGVQAIFLSLDCVDQ
ncbi:RNA methyltransferase, partial [Candidatus Saccharibacteria bacterium]|nr:RNA methyltransferase [Calditrichia bacterium]NIV71466.1 RNA methyltransferase [Calditrichia bacterium]NIV98004.1 RNA methyltransferase [Candidatus Saccharibacteria bacterium]NIW78300.1 RNA methyltransferase [Calditrichia bacterium]